MTTQLQSGSFVFFTSRGKDLSELPTNTSNNITVSALNTKI